MAVHLRKAVRAMIALDQRLLTFIDQSSEMGRKIAAFNWATTPLGPIENWSPVLKTTVALVVRSGFAKCLCWGPQHIAIYNDPFVPILGDKRDCLGKPFAEIWAESWKDIGPIADKAMAGEATFIKDFPLTITRHGDRPEEAFFTFSYSPVVDADGHVVGFMDTVMETTETVRAQRGAAIRNGELVHRMKNSYALISAVVNQTARTSDSKDDLKTRLIERLGAMGKAQDILSLSGHRGATVRDIVDHAAGGFAQGTAHRFEIAGPDVLLGDEQTFSLTLALHELCTNAAKYGSLSVEDGRVSVEWSVGSAGKDFVLAWCETGGPAVEAPKRTGFGTFLIRQALAAEFNGDVTVDYAPTGLICTLKTAKLAASEIPNTAVG